jgi:hypothetical protein
LPADVSLRDAERIDGEQDIKIAGQEFCQTVVNTDRVFAFEGFFYLMIIGG